MMALLAAVLCAASPPDAVVPEGVTAAMLTPLEAPGPWAFDVALDGQPVLARGDTFVPVKDRPERTLPTFRLAGVNVGAIAFTADGALLVVSGRALGVVSAAGFKKLVDLPADGMRLAAAGPKQVLLFAGVHLYRYTAGGRVEHLLEAPAPIDAVAADATRIVLATGRAVVELTGGAPKLLVATPARLTALALAPRGALFAASTKGIDWVANGRRYPFMAKGGEVRVRGNELFVLLEGEGLLKVAPLEGFARYGERVDAVLDGGRP